MQNLYLAAIQTDLIWENKKANLLKFGELLKRIEQPCQLIILPEMFTTGFTMNAEKHAEEMEKGETFDWLWQVATVKNMAVMGSYIVKENGNFYNRLLCMFPSGKYVFYNKRHLFTMGNEHKHYTKGEEKVIFTINDWKICPQICYDLRFPVWSRNALIKGQAEYDALVYIASWPDKRIAAWDSLLKARAIENVCYTIGVNRIGMDGNETIHTGHSGAYNFLGETLWNAESTDCIEKIVLNKKELENFRSKFPVLSDADNFGIDI
jgi:omega-amidase